MKLGILKTDTVRPQWVDEFGEYPDMFQRLLAVADPTLEFVTYDCEAQEFPQDIDEVDAYLITGSKFSVYDDEPWITSLKAFVRELHQHQKKLVGICFGHQLIADALGGRTEKSAKGWGTGVHSYEFSSLPAWHDGGNEAFSLLVSHQDQVVVNAEGASVLASSEFCENAVCQIGNHILTFQGHPEFVHNYSRQILEFRRPQLGEAVYQRGVASLADEQEGPRVAHWIVAFIRS